MSSSSTKRAARLAQKGKGKKVRFQGGTLFPLVLLGVLVAGVALIAYARFSRPAADASPPSVDDHWHLAYGFDLCGVEGIQQVQGNKEERDANGQLLSTAFLRTGVHSHDDGVIHWHAYTSAATGANATLSDFLDTYEIELTDSELRFPDDQLGGAEYVEGETMCGDEDGKLVAGVWDNFTDTGDPTIYTAAFGDIRVDQDSMVVVFAFIPENEDARDVLSMPPWAAELPALGQVDAGPAANDALLPTDTAPIGGVAPQSPTATTDDSTATTGSAPGTTASETSVPATTAAPATTGG